MNISKVFKNKYFLCAMCIFVVFAAWSTLVFQATDNSDGTHIFGVRPLIFFNTETHSFSKSSPPEFVAWINHTAFLVQDTLEQMANVSCLSVAAIFSILCIIGQAFAINLTDWNKTMFFMRI